MHIHVSFPSPLLSPKINNDLFSVRRILCMHVVACDFLCQGLNRPKIPCMIMTECMFPVPAHKNVYSFLSSTLCLDLIMHMYSSTHVTGKHNLISCIVIMRSRAKPPSATSALTCIHQLPIYSGTSELWTPRDHAEVSVIGRCPLYGECTW